MDTQAFGRSTPLLKADRLLLRVVAIRSEARDTATILLERADGAPLDYQAGQFLTFLFSFGGRELRRSYSFSSAPGIDATPSITVKRVINGEVSRYLLDHLRVGDELVSLAPAGRFVLEGPGLGAMGVRGEGRKGSLGGAEGGEVAAGQEGVEAGRVAEVPVQSGALAAGVADTEKKVPRQLFFIAAGSGMVPVFSLLKKALGEEPGSRMVLISQHHDEGSILFRRQLEELQKKYEERFGWVSILSTPGVLYSGMREREGGVCSHFGRLTNLLLEDLIQESEERMGSEPFGGKLFYLCGPPAFMRMAQFTLRLMGFTDEQIKKEHFTVEFVPPPPLLTDASPKRITVHYGGQTFEFEAAYPKTILQAALEHHIPLPYSCRGGRCSTCTARCLKGKVKMSINEVLTEKDLQEGLVLTCVGYAQTDVELAFH